MRVYSIRQLFGMGMSRLRFREELRRNLIEYQVKGAVETSIIVTPSEIEAPACASKPYTFGQAAGDRDRALY